MKDGIFHTITFASGLLQKERAEPFPLPEGLTKGLEKVSPATRRARKRPTPLRDREVFCNLLQEDERSAAAYEHCRYDW